MTPHCCVDELDGVFRICTGNSTLELQIPYYQGINGTDEKHEQFAFALFGVVLPVMVFVGLAGSVSMIYFLSRRTLWAQVNRYLIALAIWDVLLLTSSFVALALPTLMFGGKIRFYGHRIILTYPFAHTFINAAMVGCVWITVTLTLERYLAIRRPLNHKMRRSKTRIITAILIVSILATMYSVPRFFEMVVKTCRVKSGFSINVVTASPMTKTPLFEWYRMITSVLLNSVGPCTVLMVFTIHMVKILTTASRLRREMQGCTSVEATPAECWPIRKLSYARTRDGFVARLLLLILLKFFVCYTLPTVIDVVDIFPEAFDDAPFLPYLVDVSDFLVVLHSATNFIIYLVFGTRFRKEFYKIYRLYKKKFSSNVEDVMRQGPAGLPMSRACSIRMAPLNTFHSGSTR